MIGRYKSSVPPKLAEQTPPSGSGNIGSRKYKHMNVLQTAYVFLCELRGVLVFSFHFFSSLHLSRG